MATRPVRAYAMRTLILLGYATLHYEELGVTPRGTEFVKDVRGHAGMLQRDLFAVPDFTEMYHSVMDRFEQGKQYLLSDLAKALATAEPELHANERTWQYYATHLLSWYRGAGLVKRVNGRHFEKLKKEDRLTARFQAQPQAVRALEANLLTKRSGWAAFDQLGFEVLDRIANPTRDVPEERLLKLIETLSQSGLIDDFQATLLREVLSLARPSSIPHRDVDTWMHVARVVTALRKKAAEAETQRGQSQITDAFKEP
jgi:hypothetical protein